MKKDSDKLVKLMVAMGTVLIGVFAFYFLAFRQKDFDIQMLIFMTLVFIILIITTLIFFIRYKEVKKGLPLEDERSKQVLNLAASRSFYASLYWLLFISLFEKPIAGLVGLESLDAGQTVGGAIFGMSVFFIIFWMYYNRKDDVS